MHKNIYVSTYTLGYLTLYYEMESKGSQTMQLVEKQ